MSTIKIGVYTADDLLCRKIFLTSPEGTEVIRNSADADIILVDIDTSHSPDTEHITMSRNGGADICIPFGLSEISNIVNAKRNVAELTLGYEDKVAYLHGKKIKLTEVEFSLLSMLYEKGGEFAAREDLLTSVWGENVDAGILNVYIHYLREKLERDGEKIIISSRKCGYKIDAKYLGGDL